VLVAVLATLMLFFVAEAEQPCSTAVPAEKTRAALDALE
jgi:hypothetical protein